MNRHGCTAYLAVGCLLGCAHSSRSREPAHARDRAAPGAAATVRDSASPLLVLRPAAGEIWTEGRTYTIRWRATGIARVDVGMALGGKDKGHVALNLPGSIDSLRWLIPDGFVSGFGISSSDQVRVRVENAADPAQFADSPRFTIRARVKSQ
jgi:hypothetical protein